MKLQINSWCILFALGFMCFASYGTTLAFWHSSAPDFHLARQHGLQIPFEVSNDGHIFLRVRVNSSEPLLFGLDSGFEQSAISTTTAKALNLKLYGDSEVTGGGEDTESFSFTKDVSFDVSGVNFKLKEIGVLALDFPSSAPNKPIGGILGYDFISRFVVEIDFTNNFINV
jgi:hypothetical protein